MNISFCLCDEKLSQKQTASWAMVCRKLGEATAQILKLCDFFSSKVMASFWVKYSVSKITSQSELKVRTTQGKKFYNFLRI